MKNVKMLAGEFLACLFISFWGLGLLIPLVVTGGISGMLAFSVTYGVLFGVTIILFAPLSGAQIDPGFSVAWTLDGVIKWRQLPFICIVQTMGWAGGCGLLYLLFGNVIESWAECGNNPVNLFLCSYPQGTVASSFVIETLMTAFLVLCVYVFLSDAFPLRPSKAFFPFAVGMVITVLLLFGSSMTGTGINFARDLGARVAAYLYGKTHGYDVSSVFGNGQWITYFTSCVSGAVTGRWLFHMLKRQTLREQR